MKNILLLVFCFLSQFLLAQHKIPELWGHRIHDDAHIMSAATIDALEVMLKQHEDSTGNQIAIFTIESLGEETIEELAMRTATEWKLGKDKNDNGVLLLIAVDDHQMRIEVGDGLEGALPDARCSQIIRTELAPRFRANQYDEGMIGATNAIIASIAGEYKADQEETYSSGDSWFEILLMGLFVFGILGLFTAISVFTPGCGGWLLYAFLIPFYATFPLALLGNKGGVVLLGVYALGLPLLKIFVGRSAWGKRMIKNWSSSAGSVGGGRSSGSSWSSRGGFGGFGGSSSSGFSGGGGSFSGGGSSGSW